MANAMFDEQLGAPPKGREEEEKPMLDVGKLVDGRFSIRGMIGSGAVAQIFLATDGMTRSEVALKVEKNLPSGRSFCEVENNILERMQGVVQFPKRYDSNVIGPQRYIAMQLLGKSMLEFRRQSPGKPKRFSINTACRVARQMFTAVWSLHQTGFLHRDLKPANFLIGRGEGSRVIYLIDYGFGRQFRGVNGQRLPARDHPGFIGSTRFASITAHDGFEVGPGGDLESLFYTMVELYRGELPWRGIDRVAVGLAKRSTTLNKLCVGLPAAMAEFGGAVIGHRYDDEPMYPQLLTILTSVITRQNIPEDAPFDWENGFNEL